MMNGDREKIINRLVALSVFVAVLVVYIRTMAASVSFWDCGEFIACAHILGIPHPPGAPLHGMLGRLFSLLPLFGTVARRVNFLSALGGALAAGMLYLVVERVARRWYGERMGWRGRVLAMVGGITAGLWMAFSDTYWSNTVEAEVYAPAMFLMVLVVWLALRWYEARQTGGGDGLLLFVVYLLFVGIAVHLTVFLVFPVVFFLLVLSEERSGQWRFWLRFALFVLIGPVLFLFLRVLGIAIGEWSVIVLMFLGPLLFLFSWAREYVGEWRLWVMLWLLMVAAITLAEPLMVVMGLALVLSLVGMSVGAQESRGRWRVCFWVVLLAILGYTLQAFIPLRSALDPVIDENDPETWGRFMGYLKRQQYGQTSMLEGMFHRKGSWASQFGVHARMGYWGFFRQGWAPTSWWPLVVGIGLLGMVVGWFRERRRWWYLLVLMLICSLWVIFYMNFSDGTRGVQLEVRDRDYFFTPTYLAFSLWMGLGVSGLLWLVLRRVRGVLGGVAFVVLSVMLLLGPLGTLAYNYHRHDRSRNWIAHDYGYNLLNSCDQGGVLFTNGDNDTFPLWFMQEVEGVRKDVRVVNLSLLNTGWYIKQLENMPPRVRTGYSEEQADRLVPIRWPEDRDIDLGGFSHRLKEGQILRIQDRGVLNIIRANQWERPIYFAITVSPENKLDLDNHLNMESMALRLVQQEGTNMINLGRSLDLIMNHHLFRGLNDPTIFKDANTKKLLTNYAAVFSAVGQALCNQGRYEEAREVLERGVEVLYPFWGIYQVLARAYEGLGELEKGLEVGRKALRIVGEDERQMIYTTLLSLYQKTGRLEEFVNFLRERIETNSDEFSAFWALFRVYHGQGRSLDAAQVLEKWLLFHPDDAQTSRFLSSYIERMQAAGEDDNQQ